MLQVCSWSSLIVCLWRWACYWIYSRCFSFDRPSQWRGLRCGEICFLYQTDLLIPFCRVVLLDVAPVLLTASHNTASEMTFSLPLISLEMTAMVSLSFWVTGETLFDIISKLIHLDTSVIATWPLLPPCLTRFPISRLFIVMRILSHHLKTFLVAFHYHSFGILPSSISHSSSVSVSCGFLGTHPMLFFTSLVVMFGPVLFFVRL